MLTRTTLFVVLVLVVGVVSVKDDFHIRLKEGKKSRRSPDDKNVSPEFYDFDVSVNGSPVHLHVNRNDKLRTNVPTLTLSEGAFNEETIQDTEESVFYQDITNGAVFVVEEDETMARSLFGVFHVGAERYILQTPGKNRTLAFGSNYTNCEIIKQNTTDVANDPGSNLPGTIPYRRPFYQHSRRKRATGLYQVELLMFVDYSIYQFWYNKSKQNTALQRQRDAVQKIRQFYAFVINGMDALYKNIQTSAYKISILFAGIIISRTSAGAPWTETIVDRSVTPNQVDASTALRSFQTWIRDQSNLPGHDHAMLFTRYDMIQDGSTGNNGLAYVATLCTSESQSMVEDHFDFVLIRIAAHELGHSLSANHDGLGNECSAEDAYIMSPLSDPVFNNTNPWKFSSCSTGNFTAYINSLDRAGSNCMKVLSSTYNASALAEFAKKYPGQVYNADAQCENTYGTGSYFCSDNELYSGDLSAICTLMYCFEPGSIPEVCLFSRAAEGTNCGPNKWCIAGVCTRKKAKI